MTPAPALSILVVAYRMPRQVLNTLYTLTAKYQRDVSAADYEIVLVENASQDRLDPAEVSALAPNITYCYRHEVGVSPAGALNDAIAQARGTWVGLMIDGAHM
ncbi:glycosyltransferase, partial [Candidatus Nanopelagicales bacterium]|nr:glycosyltransferase [Candidatus Nanopelagicales bacterium]